MFIFILLTAYMTSPCHIEMVLTEKEDYVAPAKEEQSAARVKKLKKAKLSKKKLQRQLLNRN